MRGDWLRSLPLLLMSSLLMVGAAWAFFAGKDSTASIASFAAGLVLLGAWMTTALIDWHEGHPQEARDLASTRGEDEGA